MNFTTEDLLKQAIWADSVGQPTTAHMLRSLCAERDTTIQRVEMLESELQKSADILQAAMPVGNVKAIGLREVASGVAALQQQVAELQARLDRLCDDGLSGPVLIDDLMAFSQRVDEFRTEHTPPLTLIEQRELAEWWAERGALMGDLDDKVAELQEQLARLQEQIGKPPAGSHPDEARPRAATWHEERLNHLEEARRLREHCAALEAIVNPLNELRQDEYSSVEFICDDPNFDGQPEAGVNVCGAWTDWRPRRFTGDTVAACLAKALEAKRKYDAEENKS